MKRRKTFNFRLVVTGCVGLILVIMNLIYMSIFMFNFRPSHFGFIRFVQGIFAKNTTSLPLNYKSFFMWFIISFLLIGLGTFLFYIFIGKIIRPLEKLASYVESIKYKNNVEDELNLSSNIKEIDVLIKSFKTMNKKINEKKKEVKTVLNFLNDKIINSLSIIQLKKDMWKANFEVSDELNKMFEIIDENILYISNTFSDTYKIVNASYPVFDEEVSMMLVIDYVIDSLKDYANRKNIQLKTYYEKKFKAEKNVYGFVSGNYNNLCEAFYNIIKNGIKYNHEGGEVIIKITEYSDMFNITITDTGYPVLQRKDADIFHHFYHKYKIEDNLHYEDCINIAISNAIFEGYGEILDINSSEKGSCFNISLKKISNCKID